MQTFQLLFSLRTKNVSAQETDPFSFIFKLRWTVISNLQNPLGDCHIYDKTQGN